MGWNYGIEFCIYHYHFVFDLKGSVVQTGLGIKVSADPVDAHIYDIALDGK